MSAFHPAGRFLRRIADRILSPGTQQKPRKRTLLELEVLEERSLPSSQPNYFVFPSTPAGGPGPNGYTPDQIRTAYGINEISFNGTLADGTGQTIAIVDAYNDPVIFGGLDGFDQGASAVTGGPTLYQQYGASTSFLTVYNQNGAVINPASTNVRVDPSGPGTNNWEGEEALDVEWAHAIAPGAKIDLIECNNSNDLFPQGVETAAKLPGVSVVSMSFSSSEFSDESSYDKDFTTPSGHQGVTFLAATGDEGSPSGYPAYSPNVIAVGGTSLYLNSDNTYQGESAWSLGSDAWDPSIGTGGGISDFESEPAYQLGVQSTGFRTNPDVSFDADPDTGAAVYDSYNYGTSNAWQEYGGTSLATPAWAGLIAIANQGRVLAGGATFNSSSNPTQALTALYSLPSSDFHDITSGSNGGYSAGPGYDEVTGLGAPVANLLVPDLSTYGVASKLVLTQSPVTTAGNSFDIVVQTVDNLGDLDRTFDGTVTVNLTNNPGDSTLSGTLSVTAVNGVAAFTDLSLNNAGVGYVLQFQTAVTASDTLTANTGLFAVSPAALVPHSEQVAAPVSATDGAGNSLSYSTEVGGFSPLFVVEQQFDLLAPPGTTNYYFNARGAQEKYLISGNGSNAAGGGYYVLLPNGNLYAWIDNSLTSSLAASPAAQPGVLAYIDPTQLINATPPYNPNAAAAEQTYDLQAPPGAINFYVNSRGAGEKYLVSGNGSNAAEDGYYILMPDGSLYAWTDNSFADSLATAPVATLPVYYYENPAFLSAAAAASPISGVSASVSGGTLDVTDTGYFGSATIYVAATSSTGGTTMTTIESFVVTFTDVAPVLGPLSNQTLPFNQQATATVNASVSYGGTLTLSAQVAGYNPLFTLEQQLDLQAPPGTSNYFLNARGSQEEYLISGNGSNAAGGGYYILMPNGNLYAWVDNSIGMSLTGTPVATLPTACYQTPAELTAAVPPGTLSGVVASLSGNSLTVTDTGFAGTALISVTASDGLLSTTVSFLVTFTDSTPAVPQPSNQTVSTSQDVSILLNNGDGAGDPVTYTAQVNGYSSLFNLEQQYDLQAPASTSDYFFNARQEGEKYLVSGNGNNAAGGGYYILLPSGNIYPWDGNSLASSENGVSGSIGDVGALVYTNPTLLTNAPAPYNQAAYAAEQTLDLQAPPGASNYYFDSRGSQEKYLVSGNGSNAANGGYYVLMPNGNLYAWVGNSLNASLAGTPAAALPTSYYQNPVELTAATAPGALMGVTASISGNTLTVSDPGAYVGTVVISLVVSDGVLTNTLTFQVTFN